MARVTRNDFSGNSVKFMGVQARFPEHFVTELRLESLGNARVQVITDIMRLTEKGWGSRPRYYFGTKIHVWLSEIRLRDFSSDFNNLMTDLTNALGKDVKDKRTDWGREIEIPAVAYTEDKLGQADLIHRKAVEVLERY